MMEPCVFIDLIEIRPNCDDTYNETVLRQAIVVITMNANTEENIIIMSRLLDWTVSPLDY